VWQITSRGRRPPGGRRPPRRANVGYALFCTRAIRQTGQRLFGTNVLLAPTVSDGGGTTGTPLVLTASPSPAQYRVGRRRPAFDVHFRQRDATGQLLTA